MMIELDDRFTIPLGPDAAWRALRDVERVASCMPGARVETVSGDEIGGSIKAKLGITATTYRGTATIVERDARAHRATIDVAAEQTRRDGRATARVVLELTPAKGQDEGTEVAVRTSLEVTGTVARLGDEAVARAATRLTGQFAQRLRDELPGFAARPRPDPELGQEPAGPPATGVPGPPPSAPSAAPVGGAGGVPGRPASAVDIPRVPAPSTGLSRVPAPGSGVPSVPALGAGIPRPSAPDLGSLGPRASASAGGPHPSDRSVRAPAAAPGRRPLGRVGPWAAAAVVVAGALVVAIRAIGRGGTARGAESRRRS